MFQPKAVPVESVEWIRTGCHFIATWPSLYYTWFNSGGAFEHLGPKLKVGFHENLVSVALSWSQIFGATLLPHRHHVRQVEVWAEPSYKVLWPNLQHLSYAIVQCLDFFGTGLVCKAPFCLTYGLQSTFNKYRTFSQICMLHSICSE